MLKYSLDCPSSFSRSHEENVTAAKDPTAVEEDEDSPHQQYQVDSSEKSVTAIEGELLLLSVEDPKLDMNSKLKFSL